MWLSKSLAKIVTVHKFQGTFWFVPWQIQAFRNVRHRWRVGWALLPVQRTGQWGTGWVLDKSSQGQGATLYLHPAWESAMRAAFSMPLLQAVCFWGKSSVGLSLLIAPNTFKTLPQGNPTSGELSRPDFTKYFQDPTSGEPIGPAEV